MRIISKVEFLAKNDVTYKEVDVPGWGTVRVRSLSGAGRDVYMKGIMEWHADGTSTVKTEDAEARLLAVTLVDEEGNLWFGNVEEGVEILRQKSAGSLQKAFYAAMHLSGLQDEATDVVAENSEEITSGKHDSD